jgi:hypothetical protein
MSKNLLMKLQMTWFQRNDDVRIVSKAEQFLTKLIYLIPKYNCDLKMLVTIHNQPYLKYILIFHTMIKCVCVGGGGGEKYRSVDALTPYVIWCQQFTIYN